MATECLGVASERHRIPIGAREQLCDGLQPPRGMLRDERDAGLEHGTIDELKIGAIPAGGAVSEASSPGERAKSG